MCSHVNHSQVKLLSNSALQQVESTPAPAWVLSLRSFARTQSCCAQRASTGVEITQAWHERDSGSLQHVSEYCAIAGDAQQGIVFPICPLKNDRRYTGTSIRSVYRSEPCLEPPPLKPNLSLAGDQLDDLAEALRACSALGR
jgi:hypothetical protein